MKPVHTLVLEEGSLQHDIFMTKYAFPGETMWRECVKRVADEVGNAEDPEEKAKWVKYFYNAMNTGDFCPGGRILFGAGRPKYNKLNCYVLDPDDSIESIGKCINDMYKISCAGGGIGFNFSKIRPKGDNIANIKHSAPGSISVMKMINEIGEHVRAGKNRRTALMAILSINHPDFFEFLSVKLDRKELNNFNISVAITDDFINAVENDTEWYFTFGGRHNKYFIHEVIRICGDTKKETTIQVVAQDEEDAIGRAEAQHLIHYKDTFKDAIKCTIKARSIWDTLIKNAIECGEPGIFNIDFSNKYTNVSYFEHMPATNPCGEEVLPAYGNCCLGHVNLSNMFDEDGAIDWKKLARTIRIGVRFLDNVLTINTFPIEECKEVGLRSRRIGLGVTGLHYFLIKAGYKYGDESCLEFTERLFATIRDEAYKSSLLLAKERGSFPAYDWEKLRNEGFMKTLPSRIRSDMKKSGLRNAILLTVAPTGTISMVLGTSTGIEPIFSPVYKRRWRTGTDGVWNEAIVIDPLFKQLYLEGKSIDHCVGAYDVTPEEHIKMQAAIQAHIDSAVSKTCNLPVTFEWTPEISESLLDFAREVKGFTFYRAGSRGNEPLEAIDWRTIDLSELIINEEVINISESADACKTGVCEV